MPRKRKTPWRYDDGRSAGEFPSTPKAHYKGIYFETLDLLITCIKDCFDQPGFHIYQSFETLLIKGSKQQKFDRELDAVCSLYRDDFDKELLCSQLYTFSVHFRIRPRELGSSECFYL